MKRLLEVSLVVVVICALAAAVAANLGSGTADTVYGQASFTSAAAGSDTNVGTMNQPFDVFVDDTGNLIISEWVGNRVTICTGTTGAPADTNADVIFGADTDGERIQGTSNVRFDGPSGVAADSWGNLWVADYRNHRVLRFNGVLHLLRADATVDTYADFVLGAGSTNQNFDSDILGTSDTMFNEPLYLDFDASGNLYVSDYTNHRVLRFNATAGQIVDTAADVVWGQPTMFTNTINNNCAGGSTRSAFSLYFPRGIAIDSWNNLWIADYRNNRVLFFNNADSAAASVDTTADLLVGQISYAYDSSGVSDTMLSTRVEEVAVDRSGRVWITDFSNNRLVYLWPSNRNEFSLVSDTQFDGVFGQPSFDTNVANNNGHGGTSRSAGTLYNPTGMTIDQWGNIYIADLLNNRVLYLVVSVLIPGDDDDDCFVATAAYGGEARELDVLHQFRDETLLSSRAGRGLVSFYYAYGPSAASMIEGNSTARLLTRAALVPAVGFASLANLLGLFGAVAFLLAGAFAVAAFRRH